MAGNTGQLIQRDAAGLVANDFGLECDNLACIAMPADSPVCLVSFAMLVFLAMKKEVSGTIAHSLGSRNAVRVASSGSS